MTGITPDVVASPPLCSVDVLVVVEVVVVAASVVVADVDFSFCNFFLPLRVPISLSGSMPMPPRSWPPLLLATAGRAARPRAKATRVEVRAWPASRSGRTLGRWDDMVDSL